ncbi:MAG: hypothetical protein ACRDHW_08935, partial [Ktedonobacteraceae bacterium]
GMLSFIYVLPILFIGPLGQLIGANSVGQAVKILPTYYIAEGAYNAMQNQGVSSSLLLDLSVPLASTIVLIALTAWVLRRQSSVAAAI